MAPTEPDASKSVNVAAPYLAPFPWPRVIGFGLGVLKLSPDAFWRMTPREFALAAQAVLGPSAAPPFARAALDELMSRFPDGR